MNKSLPGNPRYQPRSLQGIFGYDNLVRGVSEVELAALDTLAEIGVIPPGDFALLKPAHREAVLAITTSEVDKLEREVTGHDIRALVQLAQARLPQELRRWVHVPLTSYDALDTGRALQFRRAHEVLCGETKKVIEIFCELVERYADTPQMGRTHGQAALPITVGFWLATILNRVVTNAIMMDQMAVGLVGKISGAVGAYNAQAALGILDKSGEQSFEERVLRKLNPPLKPGVISTQIIQPEPLSYLLFACLMQTAAFGQFGCDGRHLMRSEIAEIEEAFEATQVGSSTMAQKRNPVTFENLEGTWRKNKVEFGKVLELLVSEHQRDLVGSSIARDLPVIMVNLALQLKNLLKKGKTDERPFLSRVVVSEEALARNLASSGNLITAEPFYIGLAMAGYEGDAHEFVNRTLVPKCKQYGITLTEAAKSSSAECPEILELLGRMPEGLLDLVEEPNRYTGRASSQAMAVVERAREYLVAA